MRENALVVPKSGLRRRKIPGCANMMSKSTHSVQGPSLDWVVFQQPAMHGTDLNVVRAMLSQAPANQCALRTKRRQYNNILGVPTILLNCSGHDLPNAIRRLITYRAAIGLRPCALGGDTHCMDVHIRRDVGKRTLAHGQPVRIVFDAIGHSQQPIVKKVTHQAADGFGHA